MDLGGSYRRLRPSLFQERLSSPPRSRSCAWNGVTSIFHRNPNDAGFGNMRLYGECRVSADHSHDNPVWTEVTQLG